MDKEVENVIRHTFHIPEGELLTIWKLAGWYGCPLGDPEMGVTNCPMGFNSGRWSPTNPPFWMRERLSDDLLIHCQFCQGKPQLTREEEETLVKSYEVILGANKC